LLSGRAAKYERAIVIFPAGIQRAVAGVGVGTVEGAGEGIGVANGVDDGGAGGDAVGDGGRLVLGSGVAAAVGMAVSAGPAELCAEAVAVAPVPGDLAGTELSHPITPAPARRVATRITDHDRRMTHPRTIG
jgi:hypothetical protein